jgi:hypothetical protein
MQFGAYTLVETRRDPATGEPVDVDKSFANVLEQIELADRVGLDVFGLGEHHRPDYAVSAPSRRTQSCARSSFWARWSRPKCGRNWRSGRRRGETDGRGGASHPSRVVMNWRPSEVNNNIRMYECVSKRRRPTALFFRDGTKRGPNPLKRLRRGTKITASPTPESARFSRNGALTRRADPSKCGTPSA